VCCWGIFLCSQSNGLLKPDFTKIRKIKIKGKRNIGLQYFLFLKEKKITRFSQKNVNYFCYIWSLDTDFSLVTFLKLVKKII